MSVNEDECFGHPSMGTTVENLMLKAAFRDSALA
jgi:hypothetical protein